MYGLLLGRLLTKEKTQDKGCRLRHEVLTALERKGAGVDSIALTRNIRALMQDFYALT